MLRTVRLSQDTVVVVDNATTIRLPQGSPPATIEINHPEQIEVRWSSRPRERLTRVERRR